ncbi:MAG TPA: endonuclease/exonuclease/phosphatase family protein [Thermoanaerobaculia bacterium]|nr:endonuclease/exonuclease/phosphatase family protein [Thermoanaerobaculia bacterium]
MSTLKIMSYNIQGHAAARREDHLPKIAEVIAAAGPDVVGLQEVHCRTRAGPVHQGEALASLTGLNHWFGRSCAMNGGDYGNAVLTRGTIKSAYVHPLPGSGEPRSVLQADIALDGIELTFFATHLAAWGRLLRNARMSQIAELGDIIARGSLPHVLVGDFNVPPAAEEIRTLLSHGHLRVCGDPLEATFPMTRQRLDYVFCDPRWEFAGAEVVRRGPSDHWPLLVELRLRTE